MKKIILLTALLISALVNKAQVASYTFSQSSGTYTAISGGTQLIDGTTDLNNKISAALTIPAFIFNGVTYTKAYVTSNGILTLGNTAPASNATAGISSGTGSGICICPFSANLDRVSNDGNAEVRYRQIGVELVFQWKSMRRKTLNESFDFQARLNTVNGAVKFVYNLNFGPDNNASFPEVGIRTSSTDYNNRKVASGAENWATSLAGTANSSTVRFTSSSPAKSFVDGQTYTWTPPGQCSGSPAGGTAAATATTGVCTTGSNLSLSGNTSGFGITYQWQSSPDGSTWTDIAGATATTYSLASILATTQYRCNVTCYNSGLTSASSAVTVTRTGPAAPTFIANASVCAGSLPVNISVTAVSGCTVDWYNAASGGTLLLSGNTIYSANAAGTYYAESRNTTSSCLSTTRTAVTVTVNPLVTPTVSIAASAPGAICAGTGITFTATPTNGGTTPVYQWKLNGVNAGNNTTTYVNSSLANNNIVSCIMTSNASCLNTSTATSNALTMTVNPVVVPAVSTVGSPSGAICAGTSVTFTASPTNGGTPAYQWKRNGVNVGNNTPTYVNAALANSDIISCVMTSTATCASPSSATSPNIVMSINPTLTPSVTTTVSPSGAVCAGTSVTFTASPANGGTPAYQWKLNGINVGANQTTYVNAALANNDIVTCVMTSSATCASPAVATSNANTMTVNSVVTPSVSISAPSGALCQNSLIVYSATPLNGGGSPVYQWKVNGINVGTGASTFSYRPVNGDNVSCILTSNASCATTPTATSNLLNVSLVTPSTAGITNGDMVWTGSSSASWTDVTNWLVYAGGTVFNVPAVKPTSADNVIIENNGTCFSTVPDVPGAQACKSLTITAGNSLTMVGTASLDVYGSWTNLGTFTAGSSTINFKGSQVQQIASGGNPFYNVTFNNTSANAKSINISAPMTVTGTATFASGVAYFTGSGSLTFTDNASSNGGSAASFVAGPVSKSGNDAFIFPVGKIDPSNTKVWAPLGISNPTSLSDAFTCEYFFSASYNNLDPASMCDYNQLKATSGVEFWDLNRTIGVSTPAVTLYWKDAVRTGITDPNDLTVAHLEDCGGTPKWKAMSSTLNGITGTAGSITATGFTSFSPITFGSKNGVNPLPVTLLSFTADCGGNGKPVISWETASETDNAYFNLERSMDATNWVVAGTVKGAGNSNQKLEYRFEDENAESGTIYYRLKQYDNNGDVEGFGIIKTDCGKFTEQSSVFYYPNPFTQNLSLEISNIAARKASVVIYDILGTEVASWTLNSDDIQNKTYQLNPGNLPKGVYFIEFNSDSYSGTTKLVKK